MTRSYSVMDGEPKSSCVCGVHVNTGTKIFGWFTLIVKMCLTGYILYAFYEVVQGWSRDSKDTDEEKERFAQQVGWTLFDCIVGILCTLLMLVGAHSRRHVLFWPYLIYAFVKIFIIASTVVLLGLATYRAVFAPEDTQEELNLDSEEEKQFAITAGVFTAGTFIYGILVTYFGFIVPNRARKFLFHESI